MQMSFAIADSLTKQTILGREFKHDFIRNRLPLRVYSQSKRVPQMQLEILV
jgi:hypothetical protein